MPRFLHARTASRNLLTLLALLPFVASGCNRYRFPSYPDNYREFAYVANSSAGTVTVLDLVNLRQDRVLTVGRQPTGLAINPLRNEVYVANAGSDSLSVIDAEAGRVVATIPVQHAPYFVTVSPDGKRAYVPNTASNSVSVIDLDKRAQIGVAATGEGPGVAQVAPDNHTLLVTNRIAGSVSLYTIGPDPKKPLTFRAAFPGCPGATDAVIEADDASHPASGAKAFIACSAGHQVMDLWIAAQPDSWRGMQDPALQHDMVLARLDVGRTPTSLALKHDNGEVFVTNFDSDSVSEISTWTNEVSQTFQIGSHPVRAIVSGDNAGLWITEFGADAASLYSIDDGRVVTGVRTGPHPDALAFSADEHLLLIADSGSSDVAAIRMQSKDGPSLVTMLPAGPTPNNLVIKAFKLK